MLLEIDLSWPAALPLPLVDYSGASVNGTIASPVESVALSRRSRFHKTYGIVNFSWKLTQSQFKDFRGFFVGDLGNGAAQFKIELRYPKNSVLTEWAVRFSEKYDAVYDDGLWTVSASLDLVGPISF